MKVSKKTYLLVAIVMTIVTVMSILFIPAPIKWVGLVIGYGGLMMTVLQFSKTRKHISQTIKQYDQNKQFEEVINYVASLEPLGYRDFVLDSYVLYAYYDQGDFKSYEETVLRMKQYKQWSRPKFEAFRSKVYDNLSCIAFLKHYADTGEITYKGNNLMMMQAIEFHRQKEYEAISSLLKEYNDVPKLKKACLYVLSNDFDALDNFYTHEIANELINQIKARVKNG